jgi:hypothetical protein
MSAGDDQHDQDQNLRHQLAVLGTMTGLHQVGLTDEAASLTGSDASDAIEENGKID